MSSQAQLNPPIPAPATMTLLTPCRGSLCGTSARLASLSASRRVIEVDMCAMLLLSSQVCFLNVRWTFHQVAQTEQGRQRLRDGRLELVGGIHEITTGRVHWLTDGASRT